MKRLYTTGAFVAALALSGLPAALALAEEAETDGVRVTAETVPAVAQQMRVELQEVRETAQARRAELASSTDRAALSEEEREALKQKAEVIREDAKQQREQIREAFKNRL